MQQPQLVGIAKLASQGTVLTEKHRVEYRTLPTRHWLNRCQSDRVPFHWTINPYRGCEYGCKYCYARFTHEFMERREPEAFETEIYAKDWNLDSFRNELRSVKPGQIIGIGTGTDPYQPIERRLRLTKQVLSALTGVEGLSIFVTTKSDLVPRDKDLFRKLAERNEVGVTVTVTTMDRELARLTEPYAPRPDLRMRAVAQLAEAGVSVGVIANPVLPMITDSADNLEEIALAAKAAGAREFGANVVFLQPSSQRVFFPFLAERFPHLLKKYERAFSAGAYLRGGYPEKLSKLVNEIRMRIGIPRRDRAAFVPNPPQQSQMVLF
ncbi:MAG TPA: radical SAM protein [Bryobacteraceae bacterium]|jgi:DNA repair photolyase|nr:radical SAM protein [Bryobacteraceae bacterium]